jgi:predicted dehydrogenase
MIGIGLIGYGYWGPNLARNFAAHPECRIAAVCEQDSDRAERAAQAYPDAKITGDYRTLIEHADVDFVAIATPTSTHYQFARDALLAGKDTLVEKPLTTTVAEARELVDLAAERERILAVDHTFLYTGAVQKVKEVVDSGGLGDILYIDSVRINLGLFQHDVNVIYDLAPHDLAIAFYILDAEPTAVQALGACHAGDNMENVAYLHLEFGNNVIAHFHLNWLSPVKIRKMLIGGSKKMLVYDDMEASEKVKIYDSGITLRSDDRDEANRAKVDYRTGDMWAPKLATQEALGAEIADLASCVQTRRQPLCDGRTGMRVVRILEACQTSIKNAGVRVEPAAIP